MAELADLITSLQTDAFDESFDWSMESIHTSPSLMEKPISWWVSADYRLVNEHSILSNFNFIAWFDSIDSCERQQRINSIWPRIQGEFKAK